MSTTSTNSDEGHPLKIDRRGRVRTPPEEREKILDHYEQSGISGPRFAEAHGINYQTFAGWVHKRRKQRENQPAPSTVALAEVIVTEPTAAEPSAPEALRIELPNQAALVLSDASQVPLAVELLKAL